MENAAKDPDEIFAKYSVAEVKGLLTRLKADADAKQEELRLMVGERYRDLLHTSTSILSIAESSGRVVSSLEQMKSALYIEAPKQGKTNKSYQSTAIDVHLRAMQSLATHIKLLLDSSEHIWQLLERQQYLHAVWLFLLSRVVYRSLVHEDPEGDQLWDSQGINVLEQFPIVQRQWDNISHFRAHISQKATLSLRDISLSSENVCSSLLALHFLDSLPLLDALDVFLAQRLQALYTLTANTLDAQRPRNRTYQMTNGDIGVKKKGTVKDIWKTFCAALDAIAQTLDVARSVFKEMDPDDMPMIRKILLFIQSNEPSVGQDVSKNLQMTTKSLLSSLPSSNHFLSLPPNIIDYKPFVDVELISTGFPQSTLSQKLCSWFTEAANQLKVTLKELQNLETVRAVWEIRSSMLRWLSSSSILEATERQYIQKSTDEFCLTRIREIWKEALNDMEVSFKKSLTSLAQEVREEKSVIKAEVSANVYILSAPLLPSVIQYNPKVVQNKDSIIEYKQAIKQKVGGRTPFVDRIISETEKKTSSLQKDMFVLSNDQSLHSDVIDTYTLDANELTIRLLDAMEAFIVDDETETSESIRKDIFIGQVADKLSLSTFVKDIGCLKKTAEDFRSRAQFIYSRTIDRWRKHVVGQAFSNYFFIHRSTHDISAKPSVALLHALLHIVNSWQTHNITDYATTSKNFRNALLQDIVEGLSTSFSKEGSREQTLQLFLDLNYIKYAGISGHTDLSSIDVTIENSIAKIRKHLASTTTEQNLNALEDKIRSYARISIDQIHHLLFPLLPNITSKSLQMTTMVNGSVLESASSIPAAKEHDFESAVELVQPSSRFGLLLVGNPAIR